MLITKSDKCRDADYYLVGGQILLAKSAYQEAKRRVGGSKGVHAVRSYLRSGKMNSNRL